MLELVHIHVVVYLVTYLPPAIRCRRKKKKKKGIESLEAFIRDFIFSLASVVFCQSFSLFIS